MNYGLGTKKPRVRIAPSPTGPLHIGTARTALFNYLFAKKYGGSFILRIEDTDLERSDAQWEQDILENLHWLGIEWDEGPILQSKVRNYSEQNARYIGRAARYSEQNARYIGRAARYKGDYGPYRQSGRLERYATYLEKLFGEGKTYYCFCPEEELEAQRQEQMSRGEAPKYSGKCRQFNEQEVKMRLAKGEKSIIRFKAPAKRVAFNDLIRGKIEFDTALMGDMVIAKDIATPLYNFAAVVDDFEMQITHVIRGEDHISNTPKQILLQEALGFTSPIYAHLPLILGSDRSKLSKRHGAVSVSEYREAGYLAEALINFMAFLGWNPATEKELYSLEELVEDFALGKTQKGGAVFNMARLDYLNGAHIRKMPLEKLTELCVPYWIESGNLKMQKEKSELKTKNYAITETKEIIDLDHIKNVAALYQERLKKLSEVVELTDFFFKDVLEYNKELLRWKNMTDRDIAESIDELEKLLSEISEAGWQKENLEKIIMPIAKSKGDRGQLLWPLRVALTGKEASAGPFEIAEMLGKQKTMKRINAAKILLMQKEDANPPFGLDR